MYTVLMDFDNGEIRIPPDVAEALDMPIDFSWLVHRADRRLAITRCTDPTILAGEKQRRTSKRRSRLTECWREDAHAYCKTVNRGSMQLIGNLISGFDGSGLYTLTGAKVHAYGETVILFDLAQAMPVQYVL